MSVGWQNNNNNNNNNNPQFRVIIKNSSDHRGKETRVVFISLIHNKNSAINSLLPFFF